MQEWEHKNKGNTLKKQICNTCNILHDKGELLVSLWNAFSSTFIQEYTTYKHKIWNNEGKGVISTGNGRGQTYHSHLSSLLIFLTKTLLNIVLLLPSFRNLYEMSGVDKMPPKRRWPTPNTAPKQVQLGLGGSFKMMNKAGYA